MAASRTFVSPLTPLEAARFSRFLTGALELEFGKVITRPALTGFVAPPLTMVQSDGRFFKRAPGCPRKRLFAAINGRTG
jgi:hypothetical protein